MKSGRVNPRAVPEFPDSPPAFFALFALHSGKIEDFAGFQPEGRALRVPHLGSESPFVGLAELVPPTICLRLRRCLFFRSQIHSLAANLLRTQLDQQ